MEFAMTFTVLAAALGLFMTWGVGANDVANAMGTSVGSGAITVRKAILIATVFEFTGAFLASGHVTDTIRSGIVNAEYVPSSQVLILGMFSALLAAGVWLLIATLYSMPVSTTHSIVGALIGFGSVWLGVGSIDWIKVLGIIASWIISPVLGGLLAFGLAHSVRKFILNAESPFANAKRYSPLYLFAMGVLLTLVTIFKGLKHLHLNLSNAEAFGIAVIAGLLMAGVSILIMKRIRIDPDADREFEYASVEKLFAPLCVFTACGMAFAHGSNDVANGIGPMAAIISTIQTGAINTKAELPIWILLLGGGGIVLGLTTLGYRVIRTIGKSITELTPSRGFCAELAAAATVVIASRLGLPVSTTHIIVGAVLGVGFTRGIAVVDGSVIARIFISWIITLPAGAVLAALFFAMFRWIFS